MSEHGSFTDEPSIFEDDEAEGHGVIRIASVAALGGLLFGYDSAVINGAVQPIEKQFDVATAPLGFAVASALLGAAAGAMTAGRIADRIGRLRVMQIAAVLFFISAIWTGLAPNLEHARRRSASSAASASASRRSSRRRTSPRSPRRASAAGSVRCSSWRSSPAFSSRCWSTTSWPSSPAARSRTLWLGLEAWRWMFIVMAIPAIVYGVLSLTIPESPRYLVAQQRIPEARKVLTTLLGEKNLESRSADPGHAAKRTTSRHGATCKRATAAGLPDRLGRHAAVGVPAVRRHQRDLLLLQHPVGGGRIQRERRRS